MNLQLIYHKRILNNFLTYLKNLNFIVFFVSINRNYGENKPEDETHKLLLKYNAKFANIDKTVNLNSDDK